MGGTIGADEVSVPDEDFFDRPVLLLVEEDFEDDFGVVALLPPALR